LISEEKVKNLLDDKNISDEEIKKIRDEFYSLAEVIFENWQDEKKATK